MLDQHGNMAECDVADLARVCLSVVFARLVLV